MSFEAHKKLRESLSNIRKAEYTASHIAVLECLAYRINKDTHICFPSVETIGQESYLSERHTRKVLTQLEQDGIVEIIRLTRKSNRYRLHLPGSFVSDKKEETIDNPNVSLGNEPVLSGPERVAESRSEASEARLTNNSNQLIESGRDSNSTFLSIETAPLEHFPSGDTLSGERLRTGKPVQRLEQGTAANPNVLKLHSLLMKKVGSLSAEPSIKDATLLNEAIEQYGAGEITRLVEAVFKQKNPFWRKFLKKATYPCSALSRSLPEILRQQTSDEDSKTDSAKEKSYTVAKRTSAETTPDNEFNDDRRCAAEEEDEEAVPYKPIVWPYDDELDD